MNITDLVGAQSPPSPYAFSGVDAIAAAAAIAASGSHRRSSPSFGGSGGGGGGGRSDGGRGDGGGGGGGGFHAYGQGGYSPSPSSARGTPQRYNSPGLGGAGSGRDFSPDDELNSREKAKHHNKVSERKRREELKVQFNCLRKVLSNSSKAKNKRDLLASAVEHIHRLQRAVQQNQDEVATAVEAYERERQRAQLLFMENAMLRGELQRRTVPLRPLFPPPTALTDESGDSTMGVDPAYHRGLLPPAVAAAGIQPGLGLPRHHGIAPIKSEPPASPNSGAPPHLQHAAAAAAAAMVAANAHAQAQAQAQAAAHAHAQSQQSQQPRDRRSHGDRGDTSMGDGDDAGDGGDGGGDHHNDDDDDDEGRTRSASPEAPASPTSQ